MFISSLLYAKRYIWTPGISRDIQLIAAQPNVRRQVANDIWNSYTSKELFLHFDFTYVYFNESKLQVIKIGCVNGVSSARH